MELSTIELLGILSFAAGLVHFFAPDHWIPSAVLAWQRGWGFFRTSGFSIRLTFLHVGIAFVLFWFFQGLFLLIPQDRLLAAAVLIVGGGGVIRSLRFSKVRDVLRLGPSSSGWGVYAALSLLGPAESVIPILMKSHQMGCGYFLPILAYSAGTLVAAIGLITFGRSIWNRPLLLPLGIQWANRRITIMPAALSVLAGLALLLRV